VLRDLVVGRSVVVVEVAGIEPALLAFGTTRHRIGIGFDVR
jgi:hypothetical protein